MASRHSHDKTWYGHGLPYVTKKRLPGHLIAIEGTDGVGRSAQIESAAPVARARRLRRQQHRMDALAAALRNHQRGQGRPSADRHDILAALCRRFCRSPRARNPARAAGRLHRDRRSLHVHRVRAQLRDGRRPRLDAQSLRHGAGARPRPLPRHRRRIAHSRASSWAKGWITGNPGCISRSAPTCSIHSSATRAA